MTYAYSGEIKINFSDVIHLLSAANMLRFEEVEKSCIDLLYKNLNITNCIDVCAIAETLNYDELLRIAQIYLIKNFRWLARHSKFSEITPKQLGSVISNDKLRIASESEAYQAVIAWIKFDPEARGKHLHELLQQVRFTAMSRKYLVDVVMRESMIMDDGECRTLVLKALDHYLLPERRTLLQTQFPRKAVGQTLIIVGGRGVSNKALSSVEFYDFLEDTWAQAPSLKRARRNVSLVSLDGCLYAIGGIDADGNDLNSVERFNHDTFQWETAASLSICTGALSAITVDGWIYAVGGSYGNRALKYAERYDSIVNQWTPVTNMRLQRSHFGLTSLNGKLYAIGGYCGISEVEHCEYFDPASLKWQEITCMNKSRRNHAVATHNDCIYAIGGSSSMVGSINSIEKYNPDLNMWIVIKNSQKLSPGIVVCSCQQEGEVEELILVGGYNSDNKEISEIRKLYVKSPDYEIKRISEMKEKRVFAGAVVV